MINSAVVQRPRPTRTPPYFTPAPYKGLNTVAGTLANMGPEYALSLQNVVCSGAGVDQRTGSREWATDMAAEVTSFIPYQSGGSASSKLFAVVGEDIFDITSGGDMSAATPEVTGLSTTNVYWQSVSQTYSGATNNIMIAVNGADYPLIYNGSTWTTCTQVAVPAAVGQFTTTDNNGAAVNISEFVDVCLHNQRLWFVANNTTKGYYLDVAAASGQLHAFDFGPFFPNGSTLFKLAAWTIDTGGATGTQQLLAAISNRGDVAVYGGSDVSSDWGLIGTYKMGSPVGRRATTNIGGDVLTLGQQGLLAISKLMQSARVDVTQTITYNISPTIADLVSTLSEYDGFEVVEYPTKDVILINIPQVNPDDNFQFVYNSTNGAWSQFTGWPARCFCLFNDALYFGGDGVVYLAFIGFKDNADITGAGGDSIIATGLTAYDQMAELGLGTLKHVKLVKPFLTTGDTAPTIRIGVNVDYNLVPIVGSATLNPATGGVWDSATWDDPGSTWVGSLTTSNQWVTPLCYPGTAFALAISLSAAAETSWQGTQWVIETGGIFG